MSKFAHFRDPISHPETLQFGIADLTRYSSSAW
jgi:hypothetical protein